MAASRSLSPKVVLNSSTETVSFSLIMGMAPSSIRVKSVFRALR